MTTFHKNFWLLLAGACLGSCSPDHAAQPARPACGVVGVSVPCACSDGRVGAQSCQSDGALTDCSCTGHVDSKPQAGHGGGPGSAGVAGRGEVVAGDGGAPVDAGDPTVAGAGGCADDSCPMAMECEEGDVAGCSCAGVEAGHRLCEKGAFGACVCPDGGSAGAAGAGDGDDCIADMEWCDGRDNDCNGVVDDHFACHDDRVSAAYTQPFEGGAYFAGDSPDTSCDGKALQQFWPTLSAEYLNGFDCYVDKYRFRRSDGELFYNATFRGIVHHTAAAEVTQSSACNGVMRAGFGFDADDTLYYQCGTQLLRGSNELVADGTTALVGVLDDGRTLVTRQIAYQSYVYVVLDRTGTELNRLPVQGLFTGNLELRPEASSVVGNRAYTLLVRTYDQVTIELLLYAVDEQSVFRLVRRRIVPSAGIAQLAISDGTLFVADGAFIRGYFPDNTDAVVYRTTEGVFVRPADLSYRAQLLVGPRMAEDMP